MSKDTNTNTNTNTPHGARCNLERVRKLEACAVIARCGISTCADYINFGEDNRTEARRLRDACIALGLDPCPSDREMYDAVSAFVLESERYAAEEAR
jgi:hypothetical protein